MNAAIAKTLDLSAIGLTVLCLIHCLAAPFLALALPLLGGWAAAEWVHVLFVLIAAPLALAALVDWPARCPTSWRAVAMALVGLSFMLAGALDFPRPVWERPITLVGGLLLACAHILNWRRRHEGGSHGN